MELNDRTRKGIIMMIKGILLCISAGLVFASTTYFTPDELSVYNGQEGRAAYIAVDGVVYSVTTSNAWVNGGHHGYMSGQDLSMYIEQPSLGRSVVSGCPVVGRLVAKVTPKTLAKNNGQSSRPAYIAVDGLIYDVSTIPTLRKRAGNEVPASEVNVASRRVVGKLVK